MNDSVTIAIPETGRMSQEVLKWLAQKGAVSQSWAAKAAEAIGNVRKRDNEAAAKGDLLKRWSEGLEGVTLKYDLRSGWRLALSAKQTEMEGTPMTIYGSQYPTINGIREGLADAAVIGLDDLFAAMLPYLQTQAIARWNQLNSAIQPQESTDVRVIGSTGMQDYAGLFLLLPGKAGSLAERIRLLFERKLPLYVKGRYQGLAYYLLGSNIDARPTENIERAIEAEQCFGMDIVQTGTILAKNEIRAVGKPLLITFSVIAADISLYNQNPAVRSAIDALQPVKDPEVDYIRGAEQWQQSLKKTLGGLWISK